MEATPVLRDEGEGILAMLVVKAAAHRLRDGASVPAVLMTNAVGFFQNFADKCHYHKEEGELFPSLLEQGMPEEAGPVGMMLDEHE